MTSQEEKAKPAPETKSDFMAAEEIKTILDGRETAEQERIIRWVGESLGLTLHLRQRASHPHPQAAEHDAHRDEEESGDPAPQPSPPPGGIRDIRSLVQQKQPKSDIQFAVTVAYYHRFIAPERKEAITTDDLQEGARHSSRPVFKSPSVTLNNAVGQGYLDRAGRGEYKLNAVGENLVAMTLPGTGGEVKPKRTPRPKAATERKRKGTKRPRAK
ncbi:MAG TPA: hypothetical protein VG937_31095 [Polyangiaceae bacterium]|jgi:hypothetical protein|nr:hypothetical protein [Polyangiaceae bacterium]